MTKPLLPSSGLVALTLLLGLVASPSVAWAGLTPTSRVGPPASQSGLGDYGQPTSSWMETQATWDANGYIYVEGFVDCQADADYLGISIDGVVVAGASGFHFGGPLSVPVAPGTHTIRLDYSKNGSVDEGLDTAWVNTVRFVSNGALVAQYDFTDASGCSIPGWTRGGFDGGWCATPGPAAREWRSPVEMSYAGYQAAPRSAAISRPIMWPAGSVGQLVVDYVVDSEQDHDVFRILVDGVERFSDSGRMKRGTAAVAVDPGEHTISLEYLKDESVDEGYDQVFVERIAALAGGSPFFEGGLVGSPVGDPVPGWVQSGSDPAAAWRAAPPRSPRIYTSRDDAPRVADGLLRLAEYPTSTRLGLFPLAGDGRGEFNVMVGASTSGALFIGVELAEALGQRFIQGGSAIITLDTAGPSAPLVQDCGVGSSRPGPHARRFELAPDGSGGLSVSESVGACGSGSAAWRAATAGESWGGVVGFRSEPDDDDDSPAIIELDVTPTWPSELGQGWPVAVAVVVHGAVGGQSTVMARLPWQRDHQLELDHTGTWEQIHFAPTSLEPVPMPGVWVDQWPTNEEE